MAVTDPAGIPSGDAANPAEPLPRDTWQALRRGARKQCPACGQANLYSRYLKTVDHCSNCQEAMHHHRADDGPAYLTVTIISNLLVPVLVVMFIIWRPAPILLVLGFSAAAIIGTFTLLPRVKGAMIGVQWARRMHGFDDTLPAASPPSARDNAA